MRASRAHVEFVIGSAGIGGAELQMARLAAELRGVGWQSSVVIMGHDGPVTGILDRAEIPHMSVGFTGVSMSRVRGVPTKDSLASSRRLVSSRRRWVERPDVTHYMLDGSIAFGPYLGLFRRRPRVRVRVGGIRGYRDLSDPLSRGLFGRQILRMDAVVCNAPHLAREMTGQFGVDSGRVHVIANGVDVPGWRADPGAAPATGVVVANFRDYKGHDVLLEALALLPAEVEIAVHLCGAGGERELMRALASRLGVDGRAVFVDSPANVPEQLQAAQMGVHPSRTEGLSNAILEQLAAGLPVVASDVGGNRLLVEEGVNGFLVPPGDARALATAMERLARNPDLRVQMGQASRDRAERFAWDACTRAHTDLYTTLLEAKRDE